MKRKIFVTLFLASVGLPLLAQPTANIRLTEQSLMHESRATPSPLDGAVIDDRFISFQWPLPVEAQSDGAPMDGFEHLSKKVDKTKLAYKIRYARDKEFTRNRVEVETRWPFYNPEKTLEPGKWFWQYGYVKDGHVQWSEVLTLTVGKNDAKFCPPSLKELLIKVPKNHPRVWVMKDEWDAFIAGSVAKPERQWYLERADKVLQTPMKDVKDIKTDQVKNLTNQMQINSYLTRESRRIIDAEEQNVEALIRSYLLTKDKKYADEAIRRVMLS